MPDHHKHNLRRQLGLKEVPTNWNLDCFDYDDTHNACTCLTADKRAEECEMRDPCPQTGLSARVHTHTHTHTHIYIDIYIYIYIYICTPAEPL
jgi:hypothetical protein